MTDLVHTPSENSSTLAVNEDQYPDIIPILPIRNTVIFPSTMIPISVGRESSKKLIDETATGVRIVGCLFQKDPDIDNPAPDDLFQIGSICRIHKMFQSPTGERNVVLQGLDRFRVLEYTSDDPYLSVRYEILSGEGDVDFATEAMINSIRQNAIKMINMSAGIPDEVAIIIQNITESSALIDIIASNLNVSVEEKIKILGEDNFKERCTMINAMLARELEMAELSKKINDQVKHTIDKTQREYYLREQVKAIQKELGEEDEQSREIGELRDKIESSSMPAEIRDTALDELDRLKRINPASPEYPMIRNHMDLMIELPWGILTEDNLDIKRAQKILNDDHYGLTKIKERILEYLAVRKLNPDMKGPILCFVGPPGVGKTSLGQSIARATGREFIRMSLGGLHDEAEIRGHRRTYIGALPGRIIQGIKKAGSSNPLFMLDEIDKVGADFRGDPTSALLEVLDPQQNHTFEDNYLGVPFDLSQVMFICTGNEMSTIPGPLLDRMEVIRLPGYTEEEKLKIAQKYLVPRQLAEHGLKKNRVRINASAIRAIISGYTREAGVRNLEREIANVCRNIAKKIALGAESTFSVNRKDISEYLGPIRFFHETVERTKVPGVSIGLAWTPVGGDILFIEASSMSGAGKLLLTGQLGDTMKESAQAALSYIRANAEKIGIRNDILTNEDIHIHIPAGAIPKDGPSAGTALFSALVSLFRNKSLPPTLAMTGEITLRGSVLPVGGIKEKLIGAKNAGIKKVLMPGKNEKDLSDVPDEVKKKMDIVFVETLDDVMKHIR